MNFNRPHRDEEEDTRKPFYGAAEASERSPPFSHKTNENLALVYRNVVGPATSPALEQSRQCSKRTLELSPSGIMSPPLKRANFAASPGDSCRAPLEDSGSLARASTSSHHAVANSLFTPSCTRLEHSAMDIAGPFSLFEENEKLQRKSTRFNKAFQFDSEMRETLLSDCVKQSPAGQDGLRDEEGRRVCRESDEEGENVVPATLTPSLFDKPFRSSKY
mmetsp:Transcript_817/g.1512  ORF Transcript_817/g.1512 Transcript_817/m.1512 type:complete len:219 (-) Transcript_817:202-858(-)